MKQEIALKFRRWPFFWKTKLRTFIGESTVWHDKETGKRPGTLIEGRLSEIDWLRRYQSEKKEQ